MELIKAVQHAPATVRIIPALLIYLILPAAVLYFAVSNTKDPIQAAIKGMLLGAFIYSVYDLTNLATLKAWTVEMTIIDTLWGSTLCAVASYIGARFSS
jgi:uncharacterized membrane protein